ncbi:autotransporter strand-loop-strand O-heptosyltransferase [Enhydrobacter aerosaccus]|uniref:Autotransporter strand-loop-strand O-heptosyltransferase n=1 Tax=Enhydrobacter aerosaccus TaxID=225324 RepID=A0A1T4SCW4_9HYPH|nr:autotransporter strand-loop-strand O-heptosyltransferase [Enhydrobacter aerosaccus]SKA25738.1 autotransporter strand-loop-strand O-heptosyltransferase [Enhydrobacter aerosaccus]
MPDQIASPPQPVISVTIDAPAAVAPVSGTTPVPSVPSSGAPSTEVTAAATPMPGPPPKRAFPAPSDIPTQEGPRGVRFDFNDGCRVSLEPASQPWSVRLSDIDTGNILFETSLLSGRVQSSKRYFVHFRIEIGQKGSDQVFVHEYSAAGRDVLVQLPVGTLGDTLGWFPYAVKFKELHNCKLTVAMAEWLIPLFRDAYPDITFVNHEQVKPESFYATYNIGLFFDDKDNLLQPCDFRLVGLHRTAGYILGVDPTEAPPRLVYAGDARPIPEKYVCIAAQSTTQAKYWNNPTGWREIVEFLKRSGYRVICIDQKSTHGHGIIWNHIPYGAEDQTGDRPLQERARWLKHADFFIGLSSGLSWLAWAAGTPTVMISGFTHPLNEFHTPYRIANFHTCNSCWNDPAHRFDHKDFLWCPRHKNTDRQFECTRLITVEQIKTAIRRIPGFAEGAPAAPTV